MIYKRAKNNSPQEYSEAKQVPQPMTVGSEFQSECEGGKISDAIKMRFTEKSGRKLY